MPVPRSQNPADLVKYYSELIMEERARLEEALANISEYADRLKRVTSDTSRRLLTND